MSQVMTKAGLLKMLALEKADATNGLDTGTLNLFQNDVSPNPDTVVGDLTVATFDGYAAKTITAWGAPFLDAGGRACIVAPSQQWNPTGSVTPNLVYGWWIEDANGDLVLAGRFDDAPLAMGSPLDVIIMQPRFNLGPSS